MTDAVTAQRHRHPVSSLLWWLGHALVLVEVAVATRKFALFQDDYVFLGQGRGDAVRGGFVQAQPLTTDYLRQGLFDHFSPMTRGAFWVLGRMEPTPFWCRVAVLCVVGLFVVSLGAVCRAVLGRTVEALLLTMIAGQGLVVIHLACWTTATLNLLPAIAFCGLAFACAIRFLRDRATWWYAAASAGFFGAALLGYELAMLLPVFIGCWFLFCVGPDLGWRGVLPRIRQTFAYWAALAVLDIGAFVNYRTFYLDDSMGRPSVAEFFATLGHSFLQGLFPSVLGVYRFDHGIQLAGVVALLFWLAVLVAGAVFAGRRILGPVALGLLGWFLCISALAFGRAAVNGIYVGVDLWYNVMPLLLLVVATAEGLRLARVGDGIHRLSMPKLAGMPAVPVVLVTLTLLTAVLTQVQSSRAADPNGVSSSARRLITNFVDAVDGMEVAPAVVSTQVPNIVVIEGFYPYTYHSRVLSEYTDRVRWDVWDPGAVFRVSDDGQLHETSLVPEQQADLTEVRASRASAVGSNCYLLRRSRSYVDIPLAAPVTGSYLAVGIEGSIDRPSALRPQVLTDETAPEDATGTVTRWGRGEVRALLSPPRASTINAVRITGLRPGTTLCLGRVVVGHLS